MKYTDLVFDLYGTLVDIHTEESDVVWAKCADFFTSHGGKIGGKELKEQYQQEVKRREGKMGQSYECFPDVPFDQVMETLFLQLGVKDDVKKLAFEVSRMFRTESTEYIHVYPKAVEALDRFRQIGCKIWLLSNAQQVFTEYELRELDLFKEFDGVYLSSNYGVRKPDKSFYTALVDGEGLDINKCLMIGNDRDTDIAGAKEMGMATLYMHTALTPYDQEKAKESLHPNKTQGPHFEFEGDDWSVLAPLVEKICKG